MNDASTPDDIIPSRPAHLPPRVPRRGNAFSRALGRFLLWAMGWKVVGSPPDEPKFLVTAAPHTSNWDGAIFLIAIVALGIDMHWIGKHTLFEGRGGRFMKWMGGISVDRKAAQDVVGQIAQRCRESTQLVIVLAPEGTRRRVEQWKTGFYRMAEQAGVPIALGFMDYAKKRVGFGPALTVTGDVSADLATMDAFYRRVTPRFPELYASPLN